MAETVWALLHVSDPATCCFCHDSDAMARYEQKPDAQKMHLYGVEQGQPCIDCHNGVAHIPPLMAMDNKALDGVAVQAARIADDVKLVYPLQRIAMHDDSDSGELGTINPTPP